MTKELQEKLSTVTSVLKEIELYSNACHVMNFDMETICPPKAMEKQGETTAFLQNQAFILSKKPEFIEDFEYLYEHKEQLNEFDAVLAESLHRDYMKTKNVTPEMNHEFSLTYNKATISWLEAKQKSDFSIFAPSLKEVYNTQMKQISLRENMKPVAYDNLLDNYEKGITTADLDVAFNKCKERLVPLLKKIMASKKNIRRDFLSREVTDEQQKKMTRYLLETMGFDFERGNFALSEHPFTDGLAVDDTRITTHYYPNMFYSSMYSVIHEGGHALFEQNQPAENYEHFIQNEKTMGQHESTSRFYENRIGRSKEFIHLIYPKAKEIFPQVLNDVSEQELYEAMNIVEPSLIRTEADEFTYTFHIIIRYEIEKMIMEQKVKVEDLKNIWNTKYREYLGIEPSEDREGILQDIHWTSGFGYFPAYALGNMYNSMYYNKMNEELNIAHAVSVGDFSVINNWMKERVWKKADRQDAKTWIKEITGRDFTTKDFLDYLETKYSEIYGL